MDEYKKRIFQRHKNNLILGLIILSVALVVYILNLF